jgi:putative transposase
MPDYRRLRQPGATWFFTVNLLDRKSSLLVDQIGEPRRAVHRVKCRRPFRIEAMVILPDHLHCVWTLPEGDADYSTRWRLIRSAFSKVQPLTEWRSPAREKRHERAIWQRRFWEHCIRDDRDFAAHVAYCYLNPVKHGLVERVRDWPHSTFHRDVRLGRQEPDWTLADAKGIWGEANDRRAD